MLYLLRSISTYLFSYKLMFFFFLCALLFELSFDYFISLSMKFLIDEAIIPQNVTVFYIVLLVFIIGGILNLVIGIGGDYAMAKLSEGILIGLRKDLYTHTQRLSSAFFSRYRIGDIVSRFTLDIPAVEYAVQQTFIIGISSGLSIIVGISLMFILQWKLALLATVSFLLLFLPQKLLNKKATSLNEQYVGEVESFSNHIDETVKGYKIVRSFNLQKSLSNRFHSQMEKLFTLGVKRSFINSNLERLPIVILTLINAAILGFGGYLTFQKQITIGDYIAFHSIFITISQSIISFMEVVPDIIEGEVGMRRIKEILDIEPEFNEADQTYELSSISKEIRLENVTFAYDTEHSVIKDISISIPVSSYVAFVGSSGSGKSTIIQLLARFYDPQHGTILIDGIDLKTIKLTSLLDKIGIVFQEPFLFNSTIKENLLLARETANDDYVREIATAVDIHDSVMQLPNDYDTFIENEGSNLSTGERHLIALAQTLLRQPDILLLDEATSALDPETESSVNETINHFSKNRTVINATHRLNTITHADIIYVLDKGHIVESGTHEELINRNGLYHTLWQKQQGFLLTENGKGVIVEAERLGQLPFFKKMDLSILKELSTIFKTETKEKDQYVIRQGQKGDRFYIIVRGEVAITKNLDKGESNILAVLQDGDYFGEIALLKNIPRTANVKTLTHCVLLSLSYDQLTPLLERYPYLKEQLEETLLQRI